MKIRATLKIRNEAMLSARKRMGLSQSGLAVASGVNMHTVMRLESLDYRHGREQCWVDLLEKKATKIALVLEIPVESVLPQECIGQNIPSTHVAVGDVSIGNLLATKERFILPSPADVVMEREETSRSLPYLNGALDQLDPIDQEIIRGRWSVDGSQQKTLMEVGKSVGLTKQGVRNREQSALLALKNIIEHTDEAAFEQPIDISDGVFYHLVRQKRLGRFQKEIMRLRWGLDGTVYTLSEASRILKKTYKICAREEARGYEKLQMTRKELQNRFGIQQAAGKEMEFA